MSREIDLSLLEQYLSGEIPAEEVFDLEGKSLTAQELATGVEEYREVILQLRGSALKKDLQTIGGRVAARRTEQTTTTKKRTWWWAAASLLLLAAATLLWQQQNAKPAFEDYFTPIDQLITFRGDGTQSDAQGLEAYGRGNYEKAYELLGKSKLKAPGLLFYYGVSALGSGHWAEAQAAFEKAGTGTDNKYYQQTRWYLALAYWQLNRPDLALMQLEAIPKGEYEYEKARQLIDELR